MSGDTGNTVLALAVKRLANMTNATFGRYIYVVQQQVLWEPQFLSRITRVDDDSGCRRRIIAFFNSFPRIEYSATDAFSAYQLLMNKIDIFKFANLITTLVASPKDDAGVLSERLLNVCEKRKEDNESQLFILLVLGISYYSCTYTMNKFSYRPKHDHDDRGIEIVMAMCSKVVNSSTEKTQGDSPTNILAAILRKYNRIDQPQVQMFKIEPLLSDSISRENCTLVEIGRVVHNLARTIANISNVEVKTKLLDQCKSELFELGMYDVAAETGI